MAIKLSLSDTHTHTHTECNTVKETHWRISMATDAFCAYVTDNETWCSLCGTTSILLIQQHSKT